jgi:hypothetical protein
LSESSRPSRHGSKFDIDLLDGKAREDAFAHVITWGRFEHKRDYAASTTGNIAVEFERKKVDGSLEPSGISVTQADWWSVEFDHNAWVLLSVVRVKRLADRAVEERRVRWGGDGKRAHLALVPLGWWVEPKEAERAR